MIRMIRDLVSVIIPTFNRARYLPRTLRSVAEQDHRPIEVVLIDDGSTDATPGLIPELREMLTAHGVALKCISQPNAGPAAARNAGLKLAEGTYIACLDSDDLWKPTFLSTMLRLFNEHPSAGLTFGGYLCIDADDHLFGERPTGLPAKPVTGLLHDPFPGIMDYMPTGTPCILMRRCALDAAGPFDTEFHIGEDWDMWYRLAKQSDFAYTQEGLSLCRDHPQKMVKDDSRAIADKIKLILKHLPDVHDATVRAGQIRRVGIEMELLQEQLLRERRQANGLASLLDHDLAPHSLRYKFGAVMRRQPEWIGSLYARFVRTLGTWHRGKPLRRGAVS